MVKPVDLEEERIKVRQEIQNEETRAKARYLEELRFERRLLIQKFLLNVVGWIVIIVLGMIIYNVIW